MNEKENLVAELLPVIVCFHLDKTKCSKRMLDLQIEKMFAERKNSFNVI